MSFDAKSTVGQWSQLFYSLGTGQGPKLDSGAAEWSPHQSTDFSPKAATTGGENGKGC